jgi:hypothetical protein
MKTVRYLLAGLILIALPGLLEIKVRGTVGATSREELFHVSEDGRKIVRVTEAEVSASIAEARELQVAGTPTLFVNGRRISSQLSWEGLKQIIDIELEYQKTATNAAGSACCELKLPTPLNQ